MSPPHRCTRTVNGLMHGSMRWEYISVELGLWVSCRRSEFGMCFAWSGVLVSTDLLLVPPPTTLSAHHIFAFRDIQDQLQYMKGLITAHAVKPMSRSQVSAARDPPSSYALVRLRRTPKGTAVFSQYRCYRFRPWRLLGTVIFKCSVVLGRS